MRTNTRSRLRHLGLRHMLWFNETEIARNFFLGHLGTGAAEMLALLQTASLLTTQPANSSLNATKLSSCLDLGYSFEPNYATCFSMPRVACEAYGLYVCDKNECYGCNSGGGTSGGTCGGIRCAGGKRPPPPPPSQKMWKCDHSTCSQGIGGTFHTQAECSASCGSPPPPSQKMWKCDHSTCSQVIGGTYHTQAECSASCGSPPPPSQKMWKCDHSTCSQGIGGTYHTQAECSASCPVAHCPNHAYSQCGGKTGNHPWEGPTCCPAGYKCKVDSSFMSLCKKESPAPSPGPSPGPSPAPPKCVAAYAQCGGRDYKGPHCCVGGFECVRGNPSDPSFLQCKPKRPTHPPPPPPLRCAHAYAQCGGRGYKGPHCCVGGFDCVSGNPSDPSFLQCKPTPPL